MCFCPLQFFCFLIPPMCPYLLKLLFCGFLFSECVLNCSTLFSLFPQCVLMRSRFAMCPCSLRLLVCCVGLLPYRELFFVCLVLRCGRTRWSVFEFPNVFFSVCCFLHIDGFCSLVVFSLFPNVFLFVVICCFPMCDYLLKFVVVFPM